MFSQIRRFSNSQILDQHQVALESSFEVGSGLWIFRLADFRGLWPL